VPHPGPPAARGHLRLAGPPGERSRAENRAVLLLRAAGAVIALSLVTIVAWISATLALVPLAWRRMPMGVRLRPLRPREARIIPFQRARQKAIQR
jgi:hypothetical protein